MPRVDLLTIGRVAKRTGLSVSAIRFYESRGLISPHRNAGVSAASNAPIFVGYRLC
jgi:hypothetical protein